MTPRTDLSALSAHGSVVLGASVIAGARAVAQADYRAAEEDEFCGDEVRDILLPPWLSDNIEHVLPESAIRGLGLSLREDLQPHMYATCGVERHTDDMHGLSLCVVLHADGFTFKQGKARYTLAAGDWFIFDDRLPHEVCNTAASTSLLVVTAALQHAA